MQIMLEPVLWPAVGAVAIAGGAHLGASFDVRICAA